MLDKYPNNPATSSDQLTGLEFQDMNPSGKSKKQTLSGLGSMTFHVVLFLWLPLPVGNLVLKWLFSPLQDYLLW